jgi:hypothetical protein
MRTLLTLKVGLLAATMAMLRIETNAQEPLQVESSKEKKEKKVDTQKAIEKNGTGGDYGWSDKIGFIVGAGMNNSVDDIFAPPTIDKQNGTVQLQLAPRYRGNMSFGISYTFGAIRQIRRSISVVEQDGSLRTLTTIHREPFGISTTLFVNPGSFSNLGSNSIGTTSDLGFGLGFRKGPWALYGTLEVFQLSQPRQYFVDRYWNTDQQYTINGEVQSGIDQTDSSIFWQATYMAVGFKLCYTIDVFKQAGMSLQETPTLK